MKKIPNNLYKRILELTPVLCVDAVVKHKGKFLLVKRNNDPLKNKWWAPGGRIEKGELAEQALKRKMKEELGINVKIIKRLGFYEEFFSKNRWKIKGKSHFLSIVFLVKPLSLNIKLDEQSSNWKFAGKLPKKFIIKKFNG